MPSQFEHFHPLLLLEVWHAQREQAENTTVCLLYQDLAGWLRVFPLPCLGSRLSWETILGRSPNSPAFSDPTSSTPQEGTSSGSPLATPVQESQGHKCFPCCPQVTFNEFMAALLNFLFPPHWLIRHVIRSLSILSLYSLSLSLFKTLFNQKVAMVKHTERIFHQMAHFPHGYNRSQEPANPPKVSK